MARARKKLPDALSQDELRRLLERPNVTTTIGLRDRAMLEVMARAGLRVSELVALRPEDITWSAPGESGWIHVNDGKGGVDRNIPLYEQAERWLKAWMKERSGRAPTLFHTIAARSGGAVTSKRHTPLSPRTVREMVKGYALEAGLPAWVSPHKLRNTFATWQIAEGTPTSVVQKMMGHSRITTTEIYLAVGDPETAEAMRRISARHAEQQTLDGRVSVQAAGVAAKLEAMARELGKPVEQLTLIEIATAIAG